MKLKIVLWAALLAAVFVASVAVDIVLAVMGESSESNTGHRFRQRTL